MESPIHTVRTREGKTLEQVADAAGINMQAVYLNECGVYPTILPALQKCFQVWEYDTKVLERDYQIFIKNKRIEFGNTHNLSELTLGALGPPVENQSPLETLREYIQLSRMAFCKGLCVHPAAELRIERGEASSLGAQFKTALYDAGVGDIIISELDARVQDYHLNRSN